MTIRIASAFVSALLLLATLPVQAGYANRADVQAFVARQVASHGFEQDYLLALFAAAEKNQTILEAIARPAEKTLAWHEYRKIFVTPERTRAGLAFIREHQQTLAQAEQAFGVPVAIIAAIIGVETRYGQHMGRYRVLDALATLAFDYPPRSAFFTRELEQYLLLVREQGFDPLELKGSYAGAMGYGQFISSSYRAYAVDFDQDGVVDILGNPADAIGSVANYFRQHGWRPGEPVVLPVAAADDANLSLAANALKPDRTVADLRANGFEPAATLPAGQRVTLLGLENADGREFWAGTDNFYVITRYNHSHLYAMAVFQLAEALDNALTASTGQ